MQLLKIIFVLLSTSVKRFSVSRMRDLKNIFFSFFYLRVLWIFTLFVPSQEFRTVRNGDFLSDDDKENKDNKDKNAEDDHGEDDHGEDNHNKNNRNKDNKTGANIYLFFSLGLRIKKWYWCYSLHTLWGLVVSRMWDLFTLGLKNSLQELEVVLRKGPYLLVYDNCILTFSVFHRALDNLVCGSVCNTAAAAGRRGKHRNSPRFQLRTLELFGLGYNNIRHEDFHPLYILHPASGSAPPPPPPSFL